MKKKAQIFDIMYAIIMFLIFAIAGVTTHTILTKYDSGDVESTHGEQVITDALDSFAVIDTTAILIVAGIFVMLAVSAFLLKTHPVLLIPSILVLVFIIYISAQLSNVYETFVAADTDINSSATNTLPLTTRISFNFPMIVLVGGAIFLLAFYAKSRFGLA